MAIQEVIEVTRDKLLTIPGIQTAYIAPPEHPSPLDFPAILVYPGRGGAKWETASNANGNPTIIENHVVMIDLHLDRKANGLGQGFLDAMVYLPLIIKTIFRGFMRDGFLASVMTMGDPRSTTPPLTWEFAHLGWGTVETIGYRFRFDAAFEEEIL